MKTLLPIFYLLALQTFAQSPTLVNRQALHFALTVPNDTIDFIVVDSTLSEKKPVLLWCQGSLPIPLFIQAPGYGAYLLGGGVGNFNLPEIRKQYHLVVISMPETPLIVDDTHLDRSFCYLPDTSNPRQFSQAYLEADYLENYTNRALAVLRFLRSQPWVDNRKLVVAGHSQGAKVAVDVALHDESVTHVGLFGANPFGRIDQFVRQARADADAGKITWAQADEATEAHYAYFREIMASNSPEARTWQSFSAPRIDDWLRLNRPVYLAYGTADMTSELCDLVPLFFIHAGKTNLTYKRYAGLEHNFFEMGADGRPDHQKVHWPEVMQSFVDWTLKP